MTKTLKKSYYIIMMGLFVCSIEQKEFLSQFKWFRVETSFCSSNYIFLLIFVFPLFLIEKMKSIKIRI